ncbi:hypothetical protein J460_0258 [Acinetobacter baumannii 942133]|nr:hypothetical protein J460_0258 [Acinetobacter baumannii 942133]
MSVKVESHDTRAVRSKCFKPLLPGGVRRDNELLDTSFGRVDAFNRRRNFVSYTNPGRGEPEYPHGAPGRLLRIVWVDVKISVAVRCQLKSFAPSLFSYDNLVDGLVLHSFSGRRDGRNFCVPWR